MQNDKQLTPQQQAFVNEFNAYSNLHDFFFNEHGVILTNSEIDDIVKQIDAFKKEFNEGKGKETLNY